MKTFKQYFAEEGVVAINAVGAGNVQGIGIGPKGEPGGTKAIMNKMLNVCFLDCCMKNQYHILIQNLLPFKKSKDGLS